MLRLGGITVDPPVVLAPMAGVTNRAFRRLCRRYGGALLVGEMVNARGLVEGSQRSFELASFDRDETTRSLQLYGTDPRTIGEAVRIVVDRGADHVDLNFGCPVRKVTRHGGGAAIPARRWRGNPGTAASARRDRRRGRRRWQRHSDHREDAYGPRRRPPHVSRC